MYFFSEKDIQNKIPIRSAFLINSGDTQGILSQTELVCTKVGPKDNKLPLSFHRLLFVLSVHDTTYRLESIVQHKLVQDVPLSLANFLNLQY